MDRDEYRAAQNKLKAANLQDSMWVILEAKKLAQENGLELKQHSQWHFSLAYKRNGRAWRINVYPSNQRIWHDRKCGKAPFLEVKNNWNLLDIVRKAVETLPKAV